MAYRRRSALIAGTVTGLGFATKSFEPSLMQRSAVDQGLVTGASFLTGFVSGSAVARLVAMIPRVSTSPALRFAGLAATGLRSAQLVRSMDRPIQTPHSASAGWAALGGDIVRGIAVSRPRVDSRTSQGNVAGFATIGVAAALDLRSALANRTDTPNLRYLAIAGGVAVGANAVVAGLGGLVVAGARMPAKAVSSPRRERLAAAAGGILTASAIATAAKFVTSRLISGIEMGNERTEMAFTEPPTSLAVSGSAFTLTPYTTLGLQGRRFVSSVTSPQVIERTMGTSVLQNPVRVYVGLDPATSDEERIEVAIRELRRAGGFDRSTIIAASPAGTGYVNCITVEAAELMTRGDVATVAIQYGGLPSMLSMGRVGRASRLYALLLRRLREEIDRLDRDIRLVVYGESLGATTSQNGVDEASPTNSFIADAALWVGTPSGSALFDRLTDHDGLPVFDGYDAKLSEPVSQDRPRVTFLNHDNDPVTKFAPSITIRMPAWLKRTDRGRGTNPYQRWLPGIAFWQALIDTKIASTVVPGEFGSAGHDYRADLATFVRVAFGFSDVSDEQLAKIEDRLRKSDIARSKSIALGPVQPG